MNNEQNLDQEAINELLASANKELSGLDAPLPEVPESTEPTIAEEATAPIAVPQVLPVPPAKKEYEPLSINLLKKHLTKKYILLLIILIALSLSGGAFLGYKKIAHVSLSQTPLEIIITKGITYEEKNFVAYAGRGDKTIVTAFLEAGMSVDIVRPTDGWSPLISACFYKKSEIVSLLLENNASINLQDYHGRTALMQASAMGAEDIVTLLLAYGANPNIQDKNNRTALNEAYSKKQAKIAEILKEAGGEISPQKEIKKPALPMINSISPPPVAVTAPIASNTLISIGKAGPIQVGMPLADIQKIYPTLTLTEKYIDGRKKKIASVYINDHLTPSLELELSNGTMKLVSTISTNDEHFATDKQITIKSTVGDIRDKYSVTELRIIDNSLFLAVKSMKMLFEIDVTDSTTLKNWLSTNDPNAIPPETKIKSIVLY